MNLVMLVRAVFFAESCPICLEGVKKIRTNASLRASRSNLQPSMTRRLSPLLGGWPNYFQVRDIFKMWVV